MNTTKPITRSKTAWVNAIIAVASLFPAAAQWVSENPQATLLALGAINLALRLVTKGKVTLFDE